MTSRSGTVTVKLMPMLLVSGAILGCARQPTAVFTLSDAAKELPALHQRNIEQGLERIFGSPNQPRIAVPAPETEPAADQEDASASSADEATPEGEEEGKDQGDAQLVDIVGRRQLARGAVVYQKRCAGCHGLTGNGLGDAAPYLQPKPRDYREGIYKFTSTPYGKKPTRQDLVRTIRRGAKGTSMPAFPWMSEQDLEAVIDYVIYLSQRGEVELQMVVIAEDEYDEDEELEFADFLEMLDTVRADWSDAESQAVSPVSARPAMDQASIEAGRKIFITENCWSCHGKDAKGQTEWLSQEFLKQQADAPPEKRIAINYNAWGHPAPAADLTARMLHGGRRPLDIYRRIYTGINGTPMPEFGQLFASEPDKIWHLVHYVLYVVEGGDPTLGQPLDQPAASTVPAVGSEGQPPSVPASDSTEETPGAGSEEASTSPDAKQPPSEGSSASPSASDVDSPDVDSPDVDSPDVDSPDGPPAFLTRQHG